jgi:hypothetical protein
MTVRNFCHAAPSSTTTADAHPLDSPGESRDRVALANRERGDHVGLEWMAAIDVAAVVESDTGTAPGHGSVANNQLSNA